MKSRLGTQHEARAKIIKAIAHPSRLFIIEELNKKERCVGELTEMIGADASTVSKHLTVLKNAGLVADEKRGNSIFYHLRVPCIMQFIGCVFQCSRAHRNFKVLWSPSVRSRRLLSKTRHPADCRTHSSPGGCKECSAAGQEKRRII